MARRKFAPEPCKYPENVQSVAVSHWNTCKFFVALAMAALMVVTTPNYLEDPIEVVLLQLLLLIIVSPLIAIGYYGTFTLRYGSTIQIILCALLVGEVHNRLLRWPIYFFVWMTYKFFSRKNMARENVAALCFALAALWRARQGRPIFGDGKREPGLRKLQMKHLQKFCIEPMTPQKLSEKAADLTYEGAKLFIF